VRKCVNEPPQLSTYAHRVAVPDDLAGDCIRFDCVLEQHGPLLASSHRIAMRTRSPSTPKPRSLGSSLVAHVESRLDSQHHWIHAALGFPMSHISIRLIERSRLNRSIDVTELGHLNRWIQSSQQGCFPKVVGSLFHASGVVARTLAK
jgi:hypothetical protein